MKKASFFLFVLLLSWQTVFSQSWRRVGNWGNDFYDIQWVTNEVGYIAGENILLKSIDGGLSWMERQSPTREKVSALAFFDEQRGVLIAENAMVYQTSNGGETWTTIQLNSDETLMDVQYLDENKLALAGKGGVIYLSKDAGLTWQKQDTETTADLNGLFFLDKNHGFVVSSQSEILKTTDGGQNWEVTTSGFEATLNDIYFTNDTTGYAVGNLGTIIKTIDGGENWQFINSGIDTDLTNVAFNRSNPLIGVVSGKKGTTLRTANGGLTFVATASRTSEDIHALSFLHESNMVFAVASSGFLIASNNSGSNWGIRLSGRANDYKAVQFTTDLRGFITGDDGLILLTGNGGSSFTDRSRPISLPFNALFLTSNSAGYVSGNNGNIITTTNSGANWTTLNPGTNRNVNGLYFFNLDKGYAVGDRGLITKTENRGLNWSEIPSTEAETNFKEVVFFDEEAGIIIGEEGFVSKTNDGEEWIPIKVSTNEDLNAITPLNENTAIVVGNVGTAFKTSDQGASWEKLGVSSQVNFNDVEFLDESVGFIAGDNGLMLRTFDAGDNWEILPSGTFQNFTGLSFGDLNVGYAVGENGILYQYTCQVPQEITTIFGEDNICLSQQIYTIQDLGEEGTSYEWRIDGGTVLEGQGTSRAVIRWDSPGRNAIMVRGQNNCGNGITTALEVVVSEQPTQTSTIQGEGVVCINTLESYAVDSIPGTVYLWQATGGVVRGGQGTANITIEWTNLADQSLSVSTTNPCGEGPSTAKPIRVMTIPDQPSAIEGPTRVGIQEAEYEVVGIQDINYQWTAGDGGTIVSGQGTNLIRINWENEGDHELQVTPMNACNQGSSRTLAVNVNLITSLEHPDREVSINVFPNPSQGDLRITVYGLQDLSEIEVINALGQKTRTLKTHAGQFVYEINELPKGLYVLRFKSGFQRYNRRVLVY
ncbi:MAG: YCF48-related protein [Cyclobacteriaceae bacterium]